MPWWKGDDRLAFSVKVRGLADPGTTGDRSKRQRNEALGHWAQVMAWVASERTDGFITTDIMELFGTRESTARLVRARYERAPMIHVRTADGTPPACPCWDGRQWPADYEYLVHEYLDRNPSRSENDVRVAQKRELRSAKLKLAVRDRDHDLCRYCGRHCKHSDRISDEGMTFDHVDPLLAAGIDNLVVACRGCNNKKNRRTPREADMDLLPPPPTSGPTTEPATVAGPVTSPDVDPVTGPVTGPGGELSPDLHPDTAPSQGPTSPGRDGAGTAPSATPSNPPTIGPPDTPRGTRSTSPYVPRQPPPAGRPPPEDHPN